MLLVSYDTTSQCSSLVLVMGVSNGNVCSEMIIFVRTMPVVESLLNRVIVIHIYSAAFPGISALPHAYLRYIVYPTLSKSSKPTPSGRSKPAA